MILFARGGLQIEAQCSGSGSGADLQALARSTADNGVFQRSGVTSAGTASAASDGDFDANQTVTLAPGPFSQFSGTGVFSSLTNNIVTFDYLADDDTVSPPQGECLFVGTAVTD